MFKCKKCGWVYNPQKGDEKHNIPAGITELPENWICPICKADKSWFIGTYTNTSEKSL